jgi:hypothetical protein
MKTKKFLVWTMSLLTISFGLFDYFSDNTFNQIPLLIIMIMLTILTIGALIKERKKGA